MPRGSIMALTGMLACAALVAGAMLWQTAPPAHSGDEADRTERTPARQAVRSVANVRPSEPKPAKVSFNDDVRPILSNNCFACHGPDEKKRAEGLRLDTHASAIDDTGVIVPGKPEQSELMRRVRSEDPDVTMPLPKTNKDLTAEQIETLRRWIEQGAEYERLWSLVPPTKPALPEVEKKDWPRNGIDRFILARLEKAGLSPAPRASRRQLIRRVSLDLIGLPPTPEQVRRFVNDQSPDAYEKVVDRLLASKHYGERWARPWLDLARYADTQGYEKDLPRNIWRFRDWVITALNDDKPFDEFTIEQLAGDLLPDPSKRQLLATAFHRNTMTNTEGGTPDEEYRAAAVVDRVNTTATVWMGLTMKCAQCHSHKYDPITHEDYFSFYAFFNQTADADRGDERPKAITPTPKQQKKLKQLERKLASIKQADDTPKKKIKQQQKQVKKYKRSLPRTPIMQRLPKEKQRETHIHKRGDYRNKGKQVSPDVPEVFGDMPERYERTRLGLARWLVSGEHPMTARVQANRFWHVLFGRGIVRTLGDFGRQGASPTHPKLLDWLAVRFVEQGWSMKKLIKQMVMSATYRQSSRIIPELEEIDPNNKLLARGPRFRLEAEQIRDQVLAVSGLLNEKMLGPSVLPHQPKNTLQPQAFSNYVPKVSKGEARYRRGVYTFWRRTNHYPSFATFDAPSRKVCRVKRSRTNTPLQALVTLNDPAFVEAAQALARRLIKEGGSSPEDRVNFAFELCLARPPASDERQTMVDLYRDAYQRYQNDQKAAQQLATDPLGALPDGLAAPEAAAWTVVANAMMNLDEFLTRG
jgi:hypothetical protein